MDLSEKLTNVTLDLRFNTSPEAGAMAYPCHVKVDLSDTEVREAIEWMRKPITIAIQAKWRKRGESWLKVDENRSAEGTLQELLKTQRTVNVSAMSPKELMAQMSEEQKRATKHSMIQDMVDSGQAEWVDEDELTFNLIA